MNVMRKKADWKARRKAQGKPMLFDAGFDPNQERDERGRWVASIQNALTPDLLKPEYREENACNPMFGHCYAASEALYHILGKHKSGFVPYRGKDDRGITHWWLQNKETGEILDPTAAQYTSKGKKPPYASGTGGGFLTREPSKRAAEIMKRIRYMKDAGFDPNQPRDWHGRWSGSEAFNKWYEGSKLVENGKPIVLYHQTAKDFETFEHQGEISPNSSGLAFWFTDDPEDIPSAHRTGHGSNYPKPGTNIMPVYVRMTRPLYLNTSDPEEMEGWRKLIAGDNGNFGLPQLMTKSVRDRLIELGYDGVVAIRESKGLSNEYVALYPEQIKSAIGNKGTFDPKSKKITDAANRDDMTGTGEIRRLFWKDVKRRWQDIEQRVREGVKTYDFYGVGDRVAPFQNWITSLMVHYLVGSGNWIGTHLDKAAELATSKARVSLSDAGFDPNQPRDDKGQWSKTPEGSVVAYHGTMRKYLDSIKEKGLIIGRRNFPEDYYEGERGEVIYVADGMRAANAFATEIAEGRVGDPTAYPIIVEAHIPVDQIENLKEDEYVQGGFMFPKQIPSEWIKAYYTPDNPNVVFKNWERHHLRDGEYKIFYIVIGVPKDLISDAGFDPNQPRDEHGRWVYVVHGGADFDQIDRSRLGRGEPGNIRPLGEGLYGYVLDPSDPEAAANAIRGAKVYSTKYGRGTKMLHVFKIPKSVNAGYAGMKSPVEGMGLTKEAREEFDKNFETYARMSPVQMGKALKEDVKMERLPGGNIEIAILNPAVATRVGKYPLETDAEAILASLKNTRFADAGFDPSQPRDERGRWTETGESWNDTIKKIGAMQRGAPELAMVEAQGVMGGGVLSYAIEHTGDLTHRMTEFGDDPVFYYGHEFVEPKVRRVLRMLRQAYGFEREFKENIAANLAYSGKGLTLEEYTAKIDKVLKAYAEEHKKIPVYNDAQRHARDAAIALGEKRFWKAHNHLTELEKHLDTREEWAAYAGKRGFDTTDAEPVDWRAMSRSLTMAELKGIIEATAQQATRVMGKGLIEKRKPEQITRDVLAIMQKVGEARTKMLVDYSVIKIFSVATLESFRAQGIGTVGIIPETVPHVHVHVHVGDAARKTPQPRGKGGKFRKYAKPLSRANQRKAEQQYIQMKELAAVNVMTAEDDRVCDTCERIADEGPYSIDRALSLIPAHINCRCIFIPVGKLPMYDAYDPNQPRAPKGVSEGGQWIKTGETFIESGLEAGGGITSKPKYHQPDQRVFEVGGDDWNKKMATQLELEYVEAKPALQEIEDRAIGNTVMLSGGGGDWKSLDSSLQGLAEEKWKDANYQGYYENEVESWRDNGDALRDAGREIVYDGDRQWAIDAINELSEEDEKQPYPFKTEDIIEALDMDMPDEQIEFSLDDEKLNKMGSYLLDPDQLALPGIDVPSPAERLTQEMRDEIMDALKVAAYDKAREMADNIDPPEYLEESTKETLDMVWSEMSDDDKYQAAKDYKAIDEDTVGAVEIEDIPATYNPTQDPGKGDYRETQMMAKYMFAERAQQLIKERLGEEVDLDTINDRDAALWKGWVDSSTSNFGVVLQAAISDEFEARYRDAHFTEKIGLKAGETSKEYAKDTANRKLADPNGYEIVKAMMRAKWETTQWMLEKADMPMVNLYRGLGYNAEAIANTKKEQVGRFTKLPEIHVERNGAASSSHSPDVANEWRNIKPGTQKITLRAVVPRTAIISVPAYGQNLHKERESVVMGTAWVGWDAWYEDAPRIEDHPLEKVNS